MLNSLRELQYEFNKRKSAQLELDYKQGLPVPTVRWVINEGDIIRRRKEVQLSKLYRDAYLGWKDYYENMEYERFGSSPVKDAYWEIDPKMLTHPVPEYVRDLFGKKTPKHSGATMVFRRFPGLTIPEHELDILVKSLLGFPQPMGYKQGSNNVILNDAWTVNLRSTERENIMMDSFLRGFDGQSEQLKKAWEEKQVIGVDVSEELKDLFKVYTDAEEHLSQKEKQALETMTSCMKRYLEAQEERKKVTIKLNALKQKLAAGQAPQEDEDDEEDDE